jgi:hypothetical protein
LDFISAGGDNTINISNDYSCVPFLVAITGEAYQP